MLFEHVLEVFIGGDGDEGIEVLVWKLVFEVKRAVVEEGSGEVGGEGGEG